ncbi:PAS domain-containing protein [Priestia endophytica]|jgi:PAS domain S-box-containing protein|uniref:Biphenyl 2,3-dioxygenase n=1 Tax=Priestia endophytica TaxID=135735 RepID=A0AAX1Q3G4_9BACI|nr:STAS domain-containing protein [Priestia endophytica]RAS72199.1 biphenyl 2,3-dioxygenase [Priestia endophytica]RAS89836.1 biphenyl 2,3-dioxygenase [Priestia endophytica]
MENNQPQLKNNLISKAIDYTRVGVVITDPSLPDNPIIYTNQAFLNLTGYDEEDVIGRNCRFLQGEATNGETVREVRKAIQQKKPISIEIQNYRKDGSMFWNELAIDPVYSKENQKWYFVGIQKDITVQENYKQLLEEALKELTVLSTPIVPIAEKISVLPIIGTLTEERYEEMINQVSHYLTNAKDDVLVMDLSGLIGIDTHAAHKIFKFHELLKLMGTDLILTGIKPELAIKTEKLNLDFSSLQTFLNVKDAIKQLKG